MRTPFIETTGRAERHSWAVRAVRAERSALVCFSLALLSQGVLADTSAVSSSGFTSSFRAEIKTPPAQAWARIVQLPRWWNSSHTHSGQASNLSLDPQAGGCMCERWRDAAGASHSVQHAQVVMAQEGRVLRLSGGLGPLQDMAVVGVLTIVTSTGTGAEAGQHFLRMTYRVGGGAEAGLDKLAGAVDGVIGEQFKRLKALIETGSAD